MDRATRRRTRIVSYYLSQVQLPQMVVGVDLQPDFIYSVLKLELINILLFAPAKTEPAGVIITDVTRTTRGYNCTFGITKTLPLAITTANEI